jgi:hypothetical protein
MPSLAKRRATVFTVICGLIAAHLDTYREARIYATIIHISHIAERPSPDHRSGAGLMALEDPEDVDPCFELFEEDQETGRLISGNTREDYDTSS